MTDLLPRIAARSVRQGECLLAPGASVDEYPVIRADGRVTRINRIICEWTWGTPGPGMCALHSCDDPRCISPAHLRWGTQAENMADKAARGRCRNGQENKTHCPQGHEYNEENTYVKPKTGWRACRSCQAARSRARNAAAMARIGEAY